MGHIVGQALTKDYPLTFGLPSRAIINQGLVHMSLLFYYGSGYATIEYR